MRWRWVLFFGSALAVIVGYAIMRTPHGSGAEAGSVKAPAKEKGKPLMVSVKVFNAEGELAGPIEMPKVVKSDEEWQDFVGFGADFYHARI